MYIFGPDMENSISDTNKIYRISYTYNMQDNVIVSIDCGFHKHVIYIDDFIDFQNFSYTTLVINISLSRKAFN